MNCFFSFVNRSILQHRELVFIDLFPLAQGTQFPDPPDIHLRPSALVAPLADVGVQPPEIDNFSFPHSCSRSFLQYGQMSLPGHTR